MKALQILIGLVLIISLTRCAHLKTRVPKKAFKADYVIYYSDIQTYPKEILALPMNVQEALIQANGILPPEAYAALLEILKGLVQTIPQTIQSQNELLNNTAVVNREVIIKGYPKADIPAIMEIIKDLPTKSIQPK